MSRRSKARRPFVSASGATTGDTSAAPGAAMLHPLALASIALLIVNDHVLKSLWPGTITGKLSDFAGLVFFPLLLHGGWQIASRLRYGGCRPHGRALVAAIVVTGLVFVAVKTLPPAADAYRSGLGLLQWPVASLVAGLEGRSIPSLAPVLFVMDPTDLVALPALFLSYVIGIRRDGTADRPRLPPRPREVSRP